MPDTLYIEQWRARADELRRITTPGFESSPVGESSYNPVQMINNIWQKVLAQLVGYDATSRIPRLLAVDEFGRVVTAVGGVPTLVPSIGVVTVDVTADLIAQARSGRSYVVLENVGATDVWVNRASTVAVNAGLRLNPNQVVELRDWVDELWAIVGVGSTIVAVVER